MKRNIPLLIAEILVLGGILIAVIAPLLPTSGQPHQEVKN